MRIFFTNRYGRISSHGTETGVALLFVVVILSAILSISIGIFSLVMGELRISSELTRSFVAAYIADQGLERTHYLDTATSSPPLCPTVDFNPVDEGENCYSIPFPGVTVSTPNGDGCYMIQVSKFPPATTEIISRGEYPCGAGDFAVRRAIFIRYKIAAPEPAARWQFDAGFGASVADSGNAPPNTGTLASAPADPTWRILSGSNSALYFDGANDYFTVPDEASIDFGAADEFSMAAWVRVPVGSGSPVSRTLMDKGLNGYRIRIHTPGNLRFVKSGVGNLVQALYPNDGQWHHIAAIKRGSAVAVYVDRVGTFGTTAETLSQTPSNLTVGADSGGGRYLLGCVEELKIWRNALTDAEVSADYYSYPENPAGPTTPCP